MESWYVLLQLAGILLAARLLGGLVVRAGFPAILGELAAGILLGPSLLGWIEPSDVLRLLAEIGIILLLFEVGLDADMERLIRGGRTALSVALIGFLAPFALALGLAWITFGLPLLVALFVAGALTATSIGITVRVLRDLGRAGSVEGRIVLGAAVVDDLLGVFLLALLYDFALQGGIDPTHSLKIALLISAFVVAAPLAARIIAPLIQRLRRAGGPPGAIPTVMVSMVLGFAALAHLLGVPELLGGFVAGVALSRRFFLPFGIALRNDPEFTLEVNRQMRPIIQLFTPIFFVMVGLSLDLSIVDWGSGFIWAFSLLTLVAAIAGKLAGGLAARRLRSPERIAVGMAMVPRGEVGLVFAELGRAADVFTADVYAGLVLVIAYTTLLAPFWLKLYYRRNATQLPPTNNEWEDAPLRRIGGI